MKKVFDFFYNKHRNTILYIVFVLYILAGMAQNSTLVDIHFGDVVSRVIQIFCGVMLSIYLLIDYIKGKYKVTIFLFVGVVCAVGTLFFTHRAILCSLMAFLYVFKDCDFKKIVRVFSISILVGFIIISSLAITGCIENPVQTRGEINRVSLGFWWSPLPVAYFLFFCLAYNYVRNKKISYLELVIEAILNYGLYYLTNTRTGFILTCVVILASFIIKIFNIKKVKIWLENSKLLKKINSVFSQDKTNKNLAKIFAAMPLLFVVGFGTLVLLYGNGGELITKINYLLSDRLMLTYNAFRNRDITIFGGIFEWIENGFYIGVDSAFYNYLFNFGLFPTLFVMFITVFIFYKTFREKKYWLCFIFVLLMFDALIDSFYWDIRYNVFLLALIDGPVGRKIMFGKEKPQMTSQEDGAREKVKAGQQVMAVVVTYNRKELLKECLAALIKQDYPNLQVLVVDNCSTDGTFDYIADLVDNQKIIYSNTGENLGGAGGFNWGMKKAMQIGCDYIWLMDDDCIVGDNSLSMLVQYAHEIDDNFGFLSSVVRWKDGSICNMNVQRTSIAKEVKDFTKNQEIKFASFVSLLVKASVVENVGLPIKDFFIWGDDWEYTSRISKQYNCYLVANSVVTHKSTRNMGVDIVKDTSDRIERYFYAYRNESYLFNKLGFSGKLYYFLKKNYHKVKLLLSRSKDKKAKFAIIKKGCKAGKNFSPQIEYAYRPETKVTVCECFAEPLLYGGQEAFMLNMYKNFSNKQLQYTLFTPFEKGNKELQALASKRNENIISYNYKFDSRLRKLNIFKAYQKFFAENEFDVVHIQTGSVWALLNIAKIARKNGVKRIIVHSHCTGDCNLKYKLSKFICDRQIERYADVYLACSQLAAVWKFPKKIIDSGYYTIIKNGIDLTKFAFSQEERAKYRKTLGLTNELVLCNVGRFEYQKNHDFIVEIAKALSEKQFNFKFVLVGSGSLKEAIVKKISDCQLTDKFIFLENRSDIAQIMMASDGFVFPSRFEGLGIVAVEAQATGLLVMASPAVPNEANITDMIHFLPIDDANVWADYIINNCVPQSDRKQYAGIVAKAGYSAAASAKTLENIYLGK